MPLGAPPPPPPPLPPPSGAALLLDLDGTVLDIAPTPDAVVVPPGLLDALTRLRAHLGGALAVVTGRPVEQIDALLGPVPYAVAGEHGGAIRHAPGAGSVRAALPEPPAEWVASAQRLADAHPGVLLERKKRGFVLHYRLAPHLGPMLHEAALELIRPGAAHFGLMAAHVAWEVRPRGADKGSAVLAVMAQAPFSGRRPLFIGDDVTDEDGIRAAQSLGGAGLRVPEAFGDAAGVRAWLVASAAVLDAGGDRWALLPPG